MQHRLRTRARTDPTMRLLWGSSGRKEGVLKVSREGHLARVPPWPRWSAEEATVERGGGHEPGHKGHGGARRRATDATNDTSAAPNCGSPARLGHSDGRG